MADKYPRAERARQPDPFDFGDPHVPAADAHRRKAGRTPWDDAIDAILKRLTDVKADPSQSPFHAALLFAATVALLTIVGFFAKRADVGLVLGVMAGLIAVTVWGIVGRLFRPRRPTYAGRPPAAQVIFIPREVNYPRVEPPPAVAFLCYSVTGLTVVTLLMPCVWLLGVPLAGFCAMGWWYLLSRYPGHSGITAAAIISTIALGLGLLAAADLARELRGLDGRRGEAAVESPQFGRRPSTHPF